MTIHLHLVPRVRMSVLNFHSSIRLSDVDDDNLYLSSGLIISHSHFVLVFYFISLPCFMSNSVMIALSAHFKSQVSENNISSSE